MLGEDARPDYRWAAHTLLQHSLSTNIAIETPILRQQSPCLAWSWEAACLPAPLCILIYHLNALKLQ